MRHKKLTYHNISNWLGSFKPGDVVGYASDPNNCPCANFFKHVGLGYPSTVGNVTRGTSATGRKVYEHPEYVQRWIHAMDERPVDSIITAGEARLLLDGSL